MEENRKVLNSFLVGTFNEILRMEQTTLESLSKHHLSISEIHVIETVFKTMKSKSNTAGEIARILRITLGSLTVAVQTLEKKGYLYRQRGDEDKRIVSIFPTPLAQEMDAIHQEFHVAMVNDVISLLNEEEINILAKSLEQIKSFFERKALEAKSINKGE